MKFKERSNHNSIKKRTKCLLPTDILTKIAYVGNKLRTCFGVIDAREFKHNHDFIYQGRCPETGFTDHYLRETGRTISERVLGHAGRDQNSHLFKDSIESGHAVLDMNSYKIIEKGYENNVRKRKIAEVLPINKMKPALKKQDNSVELKLFK